MKIKSVRIEGMHKVTDKTYTFDDLNYLVGRNGAGKSTVLEAIQLGLLGYIPGYPKTGEGIFKHAKGRTMSVTLVLDNDGTDVTITRSWMGAGPTVKAAVDISPETDLSTILKDVELPIFNFSDFIGLTANKLKEWFIAFLPNAEGNINWEAKFKEAIEGRDILDTTLLSDILNEVAAFDETGVELVKKINASLKNRQSYLKGQVASLQGTIDSLVYYDDVDFTADEDDIRRQISEILETRKQLAVYTAVTSQVERITSELSSITVTGESYQTDPEVHKHEKAIIDANAAESDLSAELSGKQNKLIDIRSQIGSLSTLASGSGICPYTRESCESVSAAIKDAVKQYDELARQKQIVTTEIAEIQTKLAELHSMISSENSALLALSNMYIRKAQLQSQLAAVPECPTTQSDEELNTKYLQLCDISGKIAANKKHDELIDKITKEKYVSENSLELIKMWIKLTDANGLQTEMMNKPFEDLASDMSTYLSQMFNAPTEAKFNLAEKANSFNFGLVRDGKYISFDTLSSGEKCLYTLALMMCISNRSTSPLKLVIVDDLLDHLDKDNADFLFNALTKVSGMQMILAGVQPCSLSKIMIEI